MHGRNLRDGSSNGRRDNYVYWLIANRFSREVKRSGKQDYVWDYAGVVFPGGCLDTTQTLQFDKEQIEEIQYIGYEDEEQHHFIMQLNCQEHAIKSQFQNAGKKDEE